jgi:hypothetical protein
VLSPLPVFTLLITSLCCLPFLYLHFWLPLCVVCPCIYSFWLPLCVVYPSCIYSFWLPLCVVSPSCIYGFWLPLWVVFQERETSQRINEKREIIVGQTTQRGNQKL